MYRRKFSKALEFPVMTACPLYNWEFDLMMTRPDTNLTTISSLEEQFQSLMMVDEFGNSYVNITFMS